VQNAPEVSTPARPLLPPELPWLYLVIPLPAAYLVGHDLLDKGPWDLLRALLKMYLPFFVYGGSFQLLYMFVMPHLLGSVRSRLLRATAHIIAMIVVVVTLAWPMFPLFDWLKGRPIDRRDFLIVSFIFSSLCLFPGLALQGQRVRAQRAEHRALREREIALEAQLQALQARTDPHFLFNSINTVASLIAEDPELAERTLERLADLFRYALESSSLRTVKLQREIEMLRDYLALQSARFGDRLHTQLEVMSGLDDIEVPPLLLQPLVENAIVHGMSQRRGGRVEVAVRRVQDQLIVEVCDDGPGPGHSSHRGAGTSVRGVAERLKLHYAERASLSLRAAASGGCVAQLALPIRGLA